ncbi:hypothetical protein RHMOL_Rhmol04G0270800 [Rhododendron molle]|uniref:Uncharacterized protein n=3 Tax=Rhododendron molle TaxID=49168 RepID=A0ACC0P4L4_RHOML|nr:hypothetical protein RHMOL_Rhmol04G0270800 [Rhododendron molle]KAI8560603.1 hypothetical protein RHMOL_Rhmol04G0270800 [Rhododendron molle]KAI8560604.1 hypothetical protein RHMOL_Rhmol04G0270800 [Rhododendron molle]
MVETVFLRPNDPEYNRPLIDLYASTHGFDAWQCPENITEMGLIRTLFVSEEESPDEYEKFNHLSQFALDQYNNQQAFPCVCGTNFQFVKVLKANDEFSGSYIYYLTFQAEDTGIQLVVLLRISKHNFQPCYDINFPFNGRGTSDIPDPRDKKNFIDDYEVLRAEEIAIACRFRNPIIRQFEVPTKSIFSLQGVPPHIDNYVPVLFLEFKLTETQGGQEDDR